MPSSGSRVLGYTAASSLALVWLVVITGESSAFGVDDESARGCRYPFEDAVAGLLPQSVLQVFIIRIIDLLAPALQRFCCGSSHLAPRLLYFGVQRNSGNAAVAVAASAYQGVYLFVLLVSLVAVCLRAVLFLPGQLFLPDRLFLQPVLLLCTVLFSCAVLLVLQLFCLLCRPRLPFPLLFERGNKKQLLVKVIITRLGYDNCWWFLSCQECHKTTYVFGRHFRCSDPTCPSVNADPSYCVCTFGSDGGAEAEFMWFDKAARSVVGKPVLPLIERKYPGFTSVHDLAQIGGGDVAMPTEISRIVAQKIDQTFKPELPPLGFGGASGASGTSSSAENSGAALPILESFPTGSATLTALPLDEMNTPISAFKSKGQATMPKTPSKSPCPKNSRRKLFTTPLKITAAEVKGG
ncbi:uncharacterized protein [Triticum aestivum]|uniref:uncharacterized protein n=1 Tax=Triticum aestivum TaxID=4565 RepID=UPI001D01765C|nr:uncharacterized protein LOC123171301 [Triticum aestivum]